MLSWCPAWSPSPHRAAVALLLVLLLVLTGCGGGNSASSSQHRSSASATTGTAAASAASLPQPSKRCGAPNAPATTLRFSAEDGTTLDGAIVGSGPVGVVLLHEYPGPMCGWWPYAAYLAHHGIHVILFDFRCLGLSACPRQAEGDEVADVAGAIAALRSRGARSIALVGASLGGVTAVMAAAKLHPSAVVDLSGERNLGQLFPGTTFDSYAAAPGVRAPAMFVVARGDPQVSVADMRSVYRRVRSPVKALVVLPASEGHGWEMLPRAGGIGWSPLAGQVLRFVRRHEQPVS